MEVVPATWALRSLPPKAFQDYESLALLAPRNIDPTVKCYLFFSFPFLFFFPVTIGSFCIFFLVCAPVDLVLVGRDVSENHAELGMKESPELSKLSLDLLIFKIPPVL